MHAFGSHQPVACCFELIPWACPRDPGRSLLKLNNSPPLRGKKTYKNYTIPPGFLWLSQGSTHGETNDECISSA